MTTTPDYESQKQQPMGVVETMPGTAGFTMATFKSTEVPAGTKLSATLPPVAPFWSPLMTDTTHTETMRARFEAWMRPQLTPDHAVLLERRTDGDYVGALESECWSAWKAATAQLQPRTIAEPSDEMLGGVAYRAFDNFWTEDCSGIERHAWEAAAKAVRECLAAGRAATPTIGEIPQVGFDTAATTAGDTRRKTKPAQPRQCRTAV